MHSKQGKKRPFHTFSTHFSTNLTTDPQKSKKIYNLQIVDV